MKKHFLAILLFICFIPKTNHAGIEECIGSILATIIDSIETVANEIEDKNCGPIINASALAITTIGLITYGVLSFKDKRIQKDFTILKQNIDNQDKLTEQVTLLMKKHDITSLNDLELNKKFRNKKLFYKYAKLISGILGFGGLLAYVCTYCCCCCGCNDFVSERFFEPVCDKIC